MATELIAHVGIAVKCLQESIPRYELMLGRKAGPVLEVPDQSVRVVMFDKNDSGKSPQSAAVELLEGTSEDSPICRFIDRRGEGLHHVCILVEDIDVRLGKLKAAGVRLIDESPRVGAMGHKVAFVHPQSTGGVLIELEEKAP